MPDDPRTSDEATGLPPLEELEPATTLVVLAWDVSEGIVANTHKGETRDGGVPVRYLHCRGLITGGPSGIEWAQIHLAVPADEALDVAAALAKGTTGELG